MENSGETAEHGGRTLFKKLEALGATVYPFEKTMEKTCLRVAQLRSLVAAESKLRVHQHFTCLMRCRADGRVKENHFRMTPTINS
jgi:hypothetical protein